MARRRRSWIILLVVLVIVLGFGALKSNRVMGTVAGRDVVGSSRNILAEAYYEGGLDHATLRLGDNSATVTKETVTITDRSLPIPTACQRIEIRQARDGLHVSFDGVEQN